MFYAKTPESHGFTPFKKNGFQIRGTPLELTLMLGEAAISYGISRKLAMPADTEIVVSFENETRMPRKGSAEFGVILVEIVGSSSARSQNVDRVRGSGLLF